MYIMAPCGPACSPYDVTASLRNDFLLVYVLLHALLENWRYMYIMAPCGPASYVFSKARNSKPCLLLVYR